MPAGSWLHKDSPPVVTADVETARTEVTQGNDLLLRLEKTQTRNSTPLPVPYEVVDCGGAGNCGYCDDAEQKCSSCGGQEPG